MQTVVGNYRQVLEKVETLPPAGQFINSIRKCILYMGNKLKVFQELNLRDLLRIKSTKSLDTHPISTKYHDI